MTAGDLQRIGYWLTPAGCQAAGGHVPHADGQCTTCTVCGAVLERNAS